MYAAIVVCNPYHSLSTGKDHAEPILARSLAYFTLDPHDTKIKTIVKMTTDVVNTESLASQHAYHTFMDCVSD